MNRRTQLKARQGNARKGLEQTTLCDLCEELRDLCVNYLSIVFPYKKIGHFRKTVNERV